MTDMHKLARPLTKGVVVEIASGIPYVVLQKWRNFHKRFEETREPIANRMAVDMLSGLPAFRGEVIVGKPTDPTGFEASKLFLETDNIMHPFVYWVYDIRTTGVYDLKRRLEIARGFCDTCGPVIQYVDHELIESQTELDAYRKTVIEENFFPGIVLREPYGTFGTKDEIITSEAQAATAAN